MADWTPLLQRLVSLGLLAVTASCSVFSNDDEPSTISATSGTSSVSTTGADADAGSSTTSPPPPEQGIRVFPQYRLLDVDAIVTVHEGAADPAPCAAEPSGVGYLCDTDDVVATSVDVHVERDGFDPATLEAEVVPGMIEELTVHLVPAGGTTAMWSACVADVDFESCDAVCGSTQRSCAPASCAAADPAEPHATVARFDSPDCMGTPTAEAVACDGPAELDGASWLQCCCE